MESPIVIIPDKGHAPIAEKIKNVLLPEDTVVLHKRRISGEIVEMDRIEVSDIEGRNVVIFDDMISTGGTIVKAAGRVKEKGAKSIVVAVTHALYLSGARERILGAGVSRIITTDTIPNEDSVVPVAPVIAESLKEIIC
jgi:ribose-phosphate pyrophosphokinase